MVAKKLKGVQSGSQYNITTLFQNHAFFLKDAWKDFIPLQATIQKKDHTKWTVFNMLPIFLFVCMFSREQDNSTNSERMELQPIEISGLKKSERSDPCLVPRRLSFDENVRAKEGGKETTGETAVCTLPMVPCGSSPVTRWALASAMRKTKRLRRRLLRPHFNPLLSSHKDLLYLDLTIIKLAQS